MQKLKKPQSDAGTKAIMDTESIVRPAANHSVEESRTDQQNLPFKLEFDTRHPDMYMNKGVNVSFGSFAHTSSSHDSLDYASELIEPTLMPNDSPHSKVSLSEVTHQTPQLNSDDDFNHYDASNTMKPGLDVLTVADLKQMLGEFKLDISLAPPEGY